MVVYPDSRVAILSIHGTYLSDSSDGTLTWNKESVSRQELWQMTKYGNSRIALRGASGKYLSASPDGHVTCSKVRENRLVNVMSLAPFCRILLENGNCLTG